MLRSVWEHSDFRHTMETVGQGRPTGEAALCCDLNDEK